MYKQQRITIFDSLKGLSILAVVLYHFWSILPYGYLGVDIFFVISGFFMAKGLLKQFEENRFKYFNYVKKRVIRLWPLILIVSILSLLVGFVVMLPDDYENLSESVVASSVFANNILQCITTKNYWDVVNTYKPLMHLWYVGVLMQAYVVIPPIYWIFVKIFKKPQKGMIVGTVALTTVSLILYFLPVFSTAAKFYYLPFRIFEISAGGIGSVIVKSSLLERYQKPMSITSLALMLFMLCTPVCLISQELMLLITVAAAAIFVSVPPVLFKNSFLNKLYNVFAVIGKRSYSIYIWHQWVIAFMFYFIFMKPNVISFIIFLLITFILSFFSYRFVEIPIEKIAASKRNFVLIATGSVCAVFICTFSIFIYMRAGVVRDVPELNISQNEIHRHMHAEYCDIPYTWDKDFSQEEKIHVLVIGNSFGRDWANILYEWDQGERLDISYCTDIYSKENRVLNSDYVFYASGPGYNDIPKSVIDAVPDEKLYIVGNKSYGNSNGIIYARRYSEDYYFKTVTVDRQLLDYNTELQKIWGTHYIDLLEPIMKPDGEIRVFTDDNKYISQDCRHLTQGGAQYYGRILPLSQLFDADDLHS